MSADENVVSIVVGAFYRFDEENPENSEPALGTIDWEIKSGNGGSLSAGSSQIDFDGFATVELIGLTTVDPSTPNEYVVKATLRGTLKEIETAPIRVIPGFASQIEFAANKPLYPADEITEIKVTATVMDQFGNLLLEGTETDWDYSGLGNIKTADETINAGGKTEATFVSGPLGEQQQVTLNVDDYTDEVDLTVSPLLVQVSSSSGTLDIHTGQTAVINASFSDLNGQPVADGTEVTWFTTNGKIAGDSVTNGGVATAILNTQGGRVGKAYVAASSSGYGATLLLGFVSSAGLYLEPKDLETIEVVGPPNSVVKFSLVEAYFTVAYFPFDELQGNLVRDVISNLVGTSSGAVIDTQHHFNAPASLSFNGSALVSVAANPILAVPQGLLVSAAIRPTSGNPSKIIEKVDEYLLEIESGGIVSFSVKTPNGTFKASSALISGEWHVVQGIFSNNQVAVVVDGVTSQVASQGNIVTTANPVTIGVGFHGNIDDVAFQRKILILIGGVDSNNEVNLGPTGRATITVSPQITIPTYEKADFEIVAQVSNLGLIAQVKMSTAGTELAARVNAASANFGDQAMFVLGFLLPVEEVKSIAWEIGTLSGGGKANWRSLAGNSLLMVADLAGGKIIHGIGAGAKKFAKAWKRFHNANLDGPFKEVMENLQKSGCRSGNVDGVVNDFEEMVTYVANKSNGDVVHIMAMDVSKLGFTKLNKLHKAMGPMFIDTLIDINRTIGPNAGKKLTSALGALGENVLAHLTDPQALKGLAKVLDRGVDGQTIGRVLKNNQLFSSTIPGLGTYSRNQLGKDLFNVAHADGLVDLVKALKSASAPVKGVRYELQRGAALGADLKAFRKKIQWKSLDGKPLRDTDVDVITHSGSFNNLQLKSGAFGVAKKEEAYIQACIKQLGNIVYVVPDITKVPGYMQKFVTKYPGKVKINQWP